MYFTDELHARNFEHLSKLVFPHAKNNVEYEVLSYILSLPEIYNRCIDNPQLSEYPLLWTKVYFYSEKPIYDEEEGELYEIDIDVEEDENGNVVNSEAFETLSHGYKLMVQFGANLFNSGNDEFNLTYSISRWDESLIQVFMQALKIRFPNEKWY